MTDFINIYRVYTRRNLADTSRDPDNIIHENIGMFVSEEAAIIKAKEYIRTEFFNKDTELTQVDNGSYVAVDCCSYGAVLIVDCVQAQR